MRKALRWSAPVVLPLSLLAVLASCAGDGSTLDPAGRPLGPPEILVEPTDLGLSLLEKTSQTVSVTATNAGGLPLVIDRVSSTDPFIRPDFDGPVELRGGESREVRFEIRAGDAAASPVTGTVEIVSNDSRAPTTSVAVHLEITPTPVPEIDVRPASVDLALTEGEAEERSVRISNLGSADLVVSDISSQTSFLFPMSASAVVPPADSATVSVIVSADALLPGFHSGTVDVRSNDEDEPLVQVPFDLEVRVAATLSRIQAEVFTPSCALSICHGEGLLGNLDLREGSSFSQLVGQESAEVPGTLRVDPFRPDDSYLVCKVEGCSWMIGQQMPAVGDVLDSATIELIRRWISEGALDN